GQPVSALHLGFDAARFELHLRRDAGTPQLAQDLQRFRPPIVSNRRDECARRWLGPRALRQREDETLQAGGEANPRPVRSAERLHEAVVAATAEQRVLRSKRLPQNLECRPRVVIEAAHETM